MPQQQQPKDVKGENDAVLLGQVLEGLLRGLALSVEVFFHRSFGSAYIGSGPGAFVVMFLFATFIPSSNPRPILAFAAVYGVFWAIAVANVYIRRWRGKENVHSLYNGTPHLWRLLPRWNETSLKCLEALIVLLIGYGVRRLTHPLGDYLLTAGGFVLFRSLCFAVLRRNQAVNLNDAVIEQRELTKIFRRMQQ